MTAEPTVTLELDDIQAPLLHPRPTRYAGTVLLVRIDDRRDGRELLRRLIPFIPSGGRPMEPEPGGLGRRGAQLPGPQGAGRAGGQPRQLPAGVSAGHGRAGGRPGRHRRERARALGAAARAPGRPPRRSTRWPRTTRAWRRCSPAPATPCGMCRASRRSGGRTPTCCRTSGPRSGSRTASATRPSRAAASPAPTRTRRRSRPANSSWATRTRTATCPPRPSPRCSAATAATSSSASSRPAWRRSASTSVPAPRAEPRRSCWPPSSSAAGRAARRWCSPRSATTRSSGPIRSGTTPSSTPRTTTLAGSSARSAPTPAGRTHATRPIIGVARMHRIIRRSSSYGPMLPEGVLEDDGADRGILFFCLQANLARGFEFVKTQWINEGTFFGTPAEKDPLVGPNDGTGGFTVPQQPIRRRLHGAAPVRRQPRRRVLLHARPAGAALARRAGHLSPPTRNIDTRNHETADPLVGPRALADPASDITDEFALSQPGATRPSGARPERVPDRRAHGAVLRCAQLSLPPPAGHGHSGRRNTVSWPGRRVDVRLQIRPLPSRDSAVPRCRPARALTVSSDDPEYAATRAGVLRSAGRPQEAEQWRVTAAARYHDSWPAIRRPSPITRGRLLAHRGRRPIDRTPAPGTRSCEPLRHQGPHTAGSRCPG